MGSQTRRRKRFKQLASEVEQRITESATPKMQAVIELGRLRQQATQTRVPRALDHKPQYIGGTRARPVRLAKGERPMNTAIRSARPDSIRSSGAGRVDTTRGNSGWITKGVEL